MSLTSEEMLPCSVVSTAWIWRRPMTSRMALSATALIVPSGFCRLKTKSWARAGLTLHCTSKSMSTMFSSPVSIRLSSRTSRPRPCAPGAHVGLQHLADRVRQVVAQALAGRAGVAAEDHVDADLVRPHGVEAGREPEHDRGEDDDRRGLAAEGGAARDDGLETVLAAAQDLLEIGRAAAAALGAGAPRTAAARAAALPPRAAAAALVAPRHVRACPSP